MAEEVTVNPAEQSAMSRAAGNTLTSQGSGLTPPSTEGLNPGHADALTNTFNNQRGQYQSASNLTDAGSGADEGIGQADEESGKRFDGMEDVDDPDKRDKPGKDKPDHGNRPGRLGQDDIDKLTNPKGDSRNANPANQTAPPGGGGAPAPSPAPSSGGGGPQMPGGGAPTQSFLNSPPGSGLLNSMLNAGKAGAGDEGPASQKMGDRLPGDDGKVQNLAQKLVDAKIPYAWGGGGLNGPSQGIHDGGGAADAHGDYRKVGFDCSGLARYMHYQLTGQVVPRTSEAQWAAGHLVSAASARPGDFVFPNYAGRPPHHVQIYLGNNQVLEAPSSGQLVKVSALSAGEFRRF
jgi:hypothetical protein